MEVDILEEYGIQLLPLRYSHILRAQSIELHQRDCFDQLLIAQACEEQLKC